MLPTSNNIKALKDTEKLSALQQNTIINEPFYTVFMYWRDKSDQYDMDFWFLVLIANIDGISWSVDTIRSHLIDLVSTASDLLVACFFFFLAIFRTHNFQQFFFHRFLFSYLDY